MGFSRMAGVCFAYVMRIASVGTGSKMRDVTHQLGRDVRGLPVVPASMHPTLARNGVGGPEP